MAQKKTRRERLAEAMKAMKALKSHSSKTVVEIHRSGTYYSVHVEPTKKSQALSERRAAGREPVYCGD